MSRDMIPVEEGNAIVRAERLTVIENRLHNNVERVYESMLDIGRCLNQAKDEKLVPHGEWEAWVQQHARLSPRNAQRAMKAAREYSKATTLSHLEFSKLYALLALPADEREEFAEEVGADELTVKQLNEAIEARKAAEREREAEKKRRETLESEMRKQEADAAAECATLFAEKTALEQQLAEARNDIATNAEIERLQGELEELEDEVERRANAESRAKAELLRLQSQIARGETGNAKSGDGLTPDELGEITRAFIGRAAVLPHMRAQLSACDHNTRAIYRAQVEMVADWCERSLRALESASVEVEFV